jgi:hypothetical protein
VKPHLWNFFQAVKTRKPVTEDAVFGHHAALACHMANESYFREVLRGTSAAKAAVVAWLLCRPGRDCVTT